jgi:hypothetical protein
MGVVVLGLLIAGGWWYLSSSGQLSGIDQPSSVVVVFSARAEDGAPVARIIAVSDAQGGTARLVSPDTSVAVPGTSSGTLGDAYPFGGAAAVARAAGTGPSIGWIDVPQEQWADALDKAGGLKVVLPQPMSVFDGQRLRSFPASEQVVHGTDIGLLMGGVPYLPPAERDDVRAQVAAASLAGLARYGTAPVHGIGTNLTPAAYDRVVIALRLK